MTVYLNVYETKLETNILLVKRGMQRIKKKIWMKTMNYPNTIRTHLVTIEPKAPFPPKSTSKLRSALHIRYSIVIPRFISRANTAQS